MNLLFAFIFHALFSKVLFESKETDNDKKKKSLKFRESWKEQLPNLGLPKLGS